MSTKFDEFQDGEELQVDDIVVGLRGTTGNFTDTFFDFPGAGFKDEDGNFLLKYTSAGSLAVNFVQFQSALTGNAPIIESDGSDADVGLTIRSHVNGDLNLTTPGTGDINFTNTSGGLIVMNSTTGITGVLDEDNMSSDSATHVATQQSIKAYVDSTFVPGISSTDNAIARFDGTGGDLQDSGVLIDDSDAVSGATQLDVDNIRLNGNTVSSTDTNGNINLSPDGTGEVQTGNVFRITTNNTEISFGSGNDASIKYDGTDLLINPRDVGSGDVVLPDGHLDLKADNSQIQFGAGLDANITYDGTDLLINPQVVGSGDVVISAGNIDLNTNSVDNGDLGANTAITSAQIDNININGNTISSTDTNGNINLTPDGSGSVVIDGVDWSGMTNGQLFIGNTGSVPSTATLTAGSGITISNGAGSITISGSGGGYGWTEVTGTSQNMAVNNGYIASNSSQVDLLLPSSANIGDTVIVQGKGTGGWKISQNAGQTIHFGGSDTTTGTGGSLESTQRYDSIELLCIENNTDFAVLTAPMGTITVV